MDKVASIDLYEILNVSSNADDKEIRKKYHQLAKTLHPDKGGSKKLFELLQLAYTVLSNPITRKEYNEKHDQFIHNHDLLKNQYYDFVKGQQLPKISRNEFETLNSKLNEEAEKKAKERDKIINNKENTGNTENTENTDNVEGKDNEPCAWNNVDIGNKFSSYSKF